ncbi:MAG: oligosaccharide flippase family protein [Terracidiphilus sp.]
MTTSPKTAPVSRLRRLFSAASGDADAEHSQRRYRRAALTGATASISKVISLGTSIITVRLTFQYLGAERYGMWMTISSFVMLLAFADFGMSNGLINLVAEALGKEDRQTASRAAASAFWMLSGVATFFAVIVIAAYPFIDASRLFNVHSATARHEAGPALLAFMLCFILNLPLGTVRGTQTGMQNAYHSNLWNIFGTALSLAALLIAIHAHAGLPVLVLCLSGPPVVAALLNGVELFGRSNPDLLPAPSRFSSETARRLLGMGAMFFLLQLSFSIGLQTDNIVIAQVLGAKAVAEYAVPARLFSMILGFLVMVSGAMAPAYTDALARRDGPWIRRGFLRVTIGGTAITIVVVVLLILFGNAILRLWVGPQIHTAPALMIAFAVQSVLYAYLQPVSFLLNGIGRFKEQVISGLVMAVVNLGLSIVLVRSFGIIGAVLGTILALILVQVAPLSVVVRRELRRLGDLPADADLEPAGLASRATHSV